MADRPLLLALALPALALVSPPPCQEVADLTPTAAMPGDEVGFSVSSDGTRVAVGAPEHDGTGAVFLYTGHGSTWTLEAKLVPGSGHSGDRFGHDVSLSGGLLAVSAIRDDDAAPDAGAVYVFRWTASGWTEQEKIVPPSDGMEFGESVALRGTTLAVGEKLNARVWMYRLVGGLWTPESDADGGPLDFPGYLGLSYQSPSFGESVALDQDVLLVGDDDLEIDQGIGKIGAAFVYRRTGSVWALAQTLVNPLQQDPAEHYGESVAVAGPWAVVGAPRATAQGFTNAGVAHLFLLDASNEYQYHSTVKALDPYFGDAFADSVAIRGEQLVVGAPEKETQLQARAGAAYEFTFNGVRWLQSAKYDPGDLVASEQLGASVAIGDYAVLGAPSAVDPSGTGRVLIWQLCGL